MKIERILQRLASGLRGQLQSVGHQLGRGLVKPETEGLASLRSALSIPVGPDEQVDPQFAAGYRAALDDVLAGFIMASDTARDASRRDGRIPSEIYETKGIPDPEGRVRKIVREDRDGSPR